MRIKENPRKTKRIQEKISSILKGCKILVEVGDHEQLRASSHKVAKKYDYNISYFEVMMTNARKHEAEPKGSISIVLAQQFRMQSTLASIVSAIS